MLVVDHQKSREVQMRSGITGRFLADRQLGAANLGVLMQFAEPGASVPLHEHAVEEVLVVLDGALSVDVQGDRRTINSGESVIIPPLVRHSWSNTADRIARVLFAFASAEPFKVSRYIDGPPPNIDS